MDYLGRQVVPGLNDHEQAQRDEVYGTTYPYVVTLIDDSVRIEYLSQRQVMKAYYDPTINKLEPYNVAMERALGE